MKQMSLTTLTKVIRMIALSLIMACAVLPACAGAEESIVHSNADGALASDMINAPGASLYALAGNSVTSVIRISGGKVLGCASLTIRQGHSWSITLSLQRQVSEQSWLNMSSVTSTDSELSLSKTVSSGCYRIKVSVKVYDSDGKLIDSITRYSQTVQQK